MWFSTVRTLIDNKYTSLWWSKCCGLRSCNISLYCPFKIFSRFWLVKTRRIIHHNQLLFTKFGKNLCHIESMMSKVQPYADYWTDDFKMTSEVRFAADYWTADRKTCRRDCVIFGEQKNKEQNGETPLRTGKYFEWIIKQILNSAFIGYEEFCRSPRVLSTSAFGLCGNTLLDLQNSSYPTQPRSIIANYHIKCLPSLSDLLKIGRNNMQSDHLVTSADYEVVTWSSMKARLDQEKGCNYF